MSQGDASIYMPEHVCRGQNNSTVNAELILSTIIILKIAILDVLLELMITLKNLVKLIFQEF